MKMDMSQEKEIKRRILLPEGERKFIIKDGELSTSKGGNEMIIFTFVDTETKYEEKIYAITTQGKRFFLKQILIACGLSAGQDGIYDFEIKDLLNKEVTGLVIHEENDWINRQGETVKGKQHRIVEVRPSEEKGWDDDVK